MLERKRNESICIGGRAVIVTVVEIRGDKVRLGITAPRDVTVHRHEIQDLIDGAEPQPRCNDGL